MTRSRFGLLGLCAVVLGAMAFSASAAQATSGAQWLLAKSGESITFLPATLEAESDKIFDIHTTINKGATKILFECPFVTLINAKLLSNGSIGEAEGFVKRTKLRFSACATFINKEAFPSFACKPTGGLITTQNLHGLIVLSSGQERIQVLPDEGTTLAFIETSEECSFGSKSPLSGTLFLKDCEGLFLTRLVKHLVEVDNALSKLFFIKEENKAEILGSAWVFLGGAHIGLTWSGDPA